MYPPEWTVHWRGSVTLKLFTASDQQQISNGWQIYHNWIIHHQWTHLFWVMGKLISKNDTGTTPRQAPGRFMLEQFRIQACTYWLFSLNALTFNQRKESKWFYASWVMNRCIQTPWDRGPSGVSSWRKETLFTLVPYSVPSEMSKFMWVQWSFKSSFEWLAFKRIASQVWGTLIR